MPINKKGVVTMKKLFSLILVLLLVFTLCSTAMSENTRKEVNIWWILGGVEDAVLQGVVEKFNASQDVYHLTGTSVPDLDKIVVSMAGKDGPDAFWLYSSMVPVYSEQGLIQELDSYEQADPDFNWGLMTPASVEGCSYNGVVYGMPLHTSVCALYYSKALMTELGVDVTDLPKTWEDLYDLACKATKLDENGDIEVCGFPLFDNGAYVEDVVFAFGGRYVDDEGNYTPDDPAIIRALEMNVSFRKKFGVEACNKFVANAAATSYTADDPFLNNRQLFRIDGDWMGNLAKVVPDFEYGIVPIPGTKDNPENYGTSRAEAAMFLMSATANEPQGAWEAMKFFATEGAEEMNLGLNWVPAYKELFEAKSIQEKPGFTEFIKIIDMNKGVYWPMIPNGLEYFSKILEYTDYIYNTDMDVTQAMKEVKDYMESVN